MLTRSNKIFLGVISGLILVSLVGYKAGGQLLDNQSPTQLCSLPEVVKVYQKLNYEHTPLMDAHNLYHEYSIDGGKNTSETGVYKCWVTLQLKHGDDNIPPVTHKIYKLEMMDNGSFYVTDMTGTSW
jgi:hypothetical protein